MCENRMFLSKCGCGWESMSKEHVHIADRVEAKAFCDGEKHIQETKHKVMWFFEGYQGAT